MATDIGNVYLDVFADTKALKAQIRAAAKRAGKDFGKDFGDEAEKSMAPALSRIGRQATMKMGDNGRLSAKQFARAFQDEVRGTNLDFDVDIARSFASGDWDRVIRQFDSLEDASRRVNERLGDFNRGGALTKALKELGLSTDDVRGSLKAYTDETVRSGEETRATAEEEERRATVQRHLADQMRSGMAQALDQNEKATKRLKFATADLNDEFRATGARLDDLAKKKLLGDGDRDLRALQAQFKKVADEIRAVQRAHDVATTGMSRDSRAFGDQTADTHRRLTELRAELARISATSATVRIDTELETPDRARIASEGFTLGRLFKSAFNKGSASSGGPDFLTNFRNRWNEFLTAFPAGVTVIGRAGSAMGGALLPAISGIVSALSGGLIAAISSAAAALTALGGVAASVLPGIAFGAILAKQAFEQWGEGIGETGGALARFKESFKANDVAAFMQAWDASLAGFLDTLRVKLGDDSWAKGIGTAFAGITTALTEMLNGEAWAKFSAVMDTEIPAAVEAMGRSFIPVFEGIMTWIAAIAPSLSTFTDLLGLWATQFAEAMQVAADNGTLKAFFDAGIEALTVFGELLRGMGDLLGAVFRAGVGPGNEFIGMLATATQGMATFLASKEGQEALGQFFQSALTVLSALGPLLTALGTAFASIITPETTAGLVTFLNAITSLIPIAAQLINAFAQAGVLDLFAEAIGLIAAMMRPLIPVISQVAGMIGGALGQVMSSLAPILVTVAQIFANLLTAVSPLIPVVANLISVLAASLLPVFQAILPAIEALAPVVGQIISAFGAALTPILQALTPVLLALIPPIVEIAEKVGGILVTAFQLLSPLIVALLPLFTTLIDAIMPIIDVILDLVEPILNALMPVFMALVPIIQELIPPLLKLALAVFMPLLNVIVQLAPVIEALLPPISSLLVFLLGLIEPITPLIGFIIEMVASFLSFNTIIGGVSKALGAAGKFFSQFGANLAKMGDAVLGWLINLGNTIGGFPAKLIEMLGRGFINVLGFFEGIGGSLIGGLVKGLETAVGLLTGAFTNLVNGIISFVKGLFGISSPSSVFAEIGDFLIQGLLNGITTAWNGIVTFFTGIGETIKGWFTGAIDWLAQIGSDIFQGLFNGIQTIWNIYVAVWSAIGSTILDWFTGALDWLMQVGKDIFQGLFDGIEFVWNIYVAVWSAIGTTIKGWFTGALTWLKQIGTDIFTGLFNGIKELWDREVKGWQKIGETIKGWFTGALTWLKSIGSDIITGLFNGIREAWDTGVSFFSNVKDKFTGMFSGAINWLKNVGTDIVQGLANGISGAWDRVTTKVKELTNKIPKAVRDLLGIGSPSKVFYEIGTDTMAGLRNGIGSAGRDVIRTTQDVASSMTSAMSPASSFGVNPAWRGSQFGGAGQAVGGTTVASGAIQIVTPVRDPAIVASMVLDGLVARAQ